MKTPVVTFRIATQVANTNENVHSGGRTDVLDNINATSVVGHDHFNYLYQLIIIIIIVIILPKY